MGIGIMNVCDKCLFKRILHFVFLMWACGAAVSLWAAASATEDYQLGAGDKLKITVLNQEGLTGEYVIDGSGNFSMPFLGSIHAAGLTIRQLESLLFDKLTPDYLINPRINIQMLNYRPYYILGEVKTPNSYPYVDGMTYLNAVVIAGGFTYRAKQDHVMVIRAKDQNKNEIQLQMDDLVQPGDIIRVKERFF